MLTSVELCAGAGGQALGLEKAGFDHTALVEIDKHCCATLRHNRPQWNVLEEDVRAFKEEADAYHGIDLLAGGLPCPPFSVAGKQLGEKDERNLFDDAIEIVAATRPRAVMIENVRGFLDAVFHDYREKLKTQLAKLGYETDWRLLNASDYGVPQLRPRVAIVALRKEFSGQFNWPDPLPHNPRTVGETLLDLMKERGWRGAEDWAAKADEIAPTIVGGSKKHGGPDLGPTRARRAWAALGVEGRTIAYEAPDPFHNDMPRLTVRMVARIQGFPDSWHFTGAKTNAYRQVGNAFPPPVAEAVARQIRQAIARPSLKVVTAPAAGR
ncbi:DNA cytosine methyltransferase [Phaeobacter inhibens]|uniref:Cytosine-specific methyltransferase n=1 Tax=Phaeobacter inhibens TaxID=221822 RepID=A0A135IJS9_9RHOB|nr:MULTISPECIES: DNA cytosine methyltransferase [Phaeobacter]AFO86938.1 modification methylase NaeI [Phaeobacter inhibens 2.10]AFO90659.1 modification methylase NaeI [Phaeobacter inhibens DSM 17395]APX17287.1 DNA cytosine methyltransferase [Phaeobacter inhibens]AUQ45310.1 modification methylase NaeI [Phaeobacter inhibens]AUQ53619.1 modification methylase NaeI [Phaeobacter inhibens]